MLFTRDQPRILSKIFRLFSSCLIAARGEGRGPWIVNSFLNATCSLVFPDQADILLGVNIKEKSLLFIHFYAPCVNSERQWGFFSSDQPYTVEAGIFTG